MQHDFDGVHLTSLWQEIFTFKEYQRQSCLNIFLAYSQYVHVGDIYSYYSKQQKCRLL